MGLLSPNQMFEQMMQQSRPNPSVELQIDPYGAAMMRVGEALGNVGAGLFGVDPRNETQITRQKLMEVMGNMDLTNQDQLKQLATIAANYGDTEIMQWAVDQYNALKKMDIDVMRALPDLTGKGPSYTTRIAEDEEGNRYFILTNRYNDKDVKVLVNGIPYPMDEWIKQTGKKLTPARLGAEATPVSPKQIFKELKELFGGFGYSDTVTQQASRLLSSKIGTLLRRPKVQRTLGQEGLYSIAQEVFRDLAGSWKVLKFSPEEREILLKEFSRRVQEELAVLESKPEQLRTERNKTNDEQKQIKVPKKETKTETKKGKVIFENDYFTVYE